MKRRIVLAHKTAPSWPHTSTSRAWAACGLFALQHDHCGSFRIANRYLLTLDQHLTGLDRLPTQETDHLRLLARTLKQPVLEVSILTINAPNANHVQATFRTPTGWYSKLLALATLEP